MTAAPMRAIFAIARNDIRLLVRDKGALFFTMVFPLLLAVFFGAIFGGRGSGKMTVALVNEDAGAVAAAFAADIAADSSLEVVTRTAGEGGPGDPLTRAQGVAMVRRGAADACVVVPKGFDSAGIFSGQAMKVDCTVAPGRSAEGGLLIGKLNELAFKQLSSAFGDMSKMSGMLDNARRSVRSNAEMSEANRGVLNDMFDRIDTVNKTFGGITPGGAAAPGEKPEGGFSWRPVEVSMTELKDESNRPRSSWEISFPQGVVWALMGCVTGFGVSLSGERARGTMTRLSTAPITRHHILLGKALGCFLTCVAVQALLIGMAVLVFGGMMGQFAVQNPLMMAAAIMMGSFGFTGLMMLLAGLTRTEGGASGMGRGLIIVLAMIGGGTVPLFFLPPWVQTLSNVSPFKWVTVSIEGAIWRGFTWGDFALPAAVLAGFGVAGFVIGSWALKVGERT